MLKIIPALEAIEKEEVRGGCRGEEGTLGASLVVKTSASSAAAAAPPLVIAAISFIPDGRPRMTLEIWSHHNFGRWNFGPGGGGGQLGESWRTFPPKLNRTFNRRSHLATSFFRTLHFTELWPRTTFGNCWKLLSKLNWTSNRHYDKFVSLFVNCLEIERGKFLSKLAGVGGFKPECMLTLTTPAVPVIPHDAELTLSPYCWCTVTTTNVVT